MDPRVSEVRLSAVSKDFDREIIALCRARSFAEVGFLGDAVLEAIQKSSERFAKRHGAFLLKSTDASGYNDHLKAFERVLIFDAVPARLGLR